MRVLHCAIRFGFMLAIGWSAACAADPAADFPDRPVRLVVPFSPGQGSDVLARLLGQALGERWGQPVVIDNRPGANGTIALQEVVRARADGHTLLLTSNSPIAINPVFYRHLAYDPMRDLVPVMRVARTDMVLIVHPSFAAHTWREVAERVKAEPGRYSFGSPGLGSTAHLTMEIFRRQIGAELTHVPYRGSVAAQADLLGGNLQLMFDAMPSALPQIRAGRVRAIGVPGSAPSRSLPELATSASAGFGDLPNPAWYGVFAPHATPASRIDAVNRALAQALARPDVQARMWELALEPVAAHPPQAFAAFVRDDIAAWAARLQALGLYQRE